VAARLSQVRGLWAACGAVVSGFRRSYCRRVGLCAGAVTFGVFAALLAALFLALTPIGVAVDRSNNTDSCLIMALLATWAFARALETGRGGLLILSIACVGTSFNLKMAAAPVPALEPAELYDMRPAPSGGRNHVGRGGLEKPTDGTFAGNKTCPQTAATWFQQRYVTLTGQCVLLYSIEVAPVL